MKVLSIWLLALLLPNQTFQVLQDRSFYESCEKKGGSLIRIPGNSYESEKCEVILPLYSENKEDAQYHCKRWGIFPLVTAEVTTGDHAKCVYTNVYACRQDYTQIRGMCYKIMWELMTYEEAKKECKKDQGSEVLRYYDELGELLDDNLDDLSLFHIQPESDLEKAPRFFGGAGPIFVLLFSQYIHFNAGFNTILRFPAHQKAHTMCQYRPEETLYSFEVMIRKLGGLYHPAMVNGATLIWRTSGLYSRKNWPYYSRDSMDKELVCQDSMASILGTKDGTLANPNKQLTSILTSDIKQSFVTGYAPIEFRYEWDDGTYVHVHHYFRSKENFDNMALQKKIDNQDYNGDFKTFYSKKIERESHMYLYVPQMTSGYNIITREFANYGPMLCTISYNHIVHICDAMFSFKYKGKTMCITTILEKMVFVDAVKACKKLTPPAEIVHWTSKSEFDALLYYKKLGGQDGIAWVNCNKQNGCAQGAEAVGALSSYNLDGNPSLSSYHTVICIREPVP